MVPLSESLLEGFDPNTLYVRLQAHLEAGHWIEAIAVCYRILNVEPDYRDVSQLLERAREQLALEREQSRRAKEAWRGILAPVTERTQPRRRRWLLVLFILGLGTCLLAVVLAVVILLFRRQLSVVRAPLGPGTAQTPWAPMAVADMQSYTNSEGRFLLKYPQGWVIKESPSEGQPLRIVLITPEARDQPERVTILF